MKVLQGIAIALCLIMSTTTAVFSWKIYQAYQVLEPKVATAQRHYNELMAAREKADATIAEIKEAASLKQIEDRLDEMSESFTAHQTALDDMKSRFKGVETYTNGLKHKIKGGVANLWPEKPEKPAKQTAP